MRVILRNILIASLLCLFISCEEEQTNEPADGVSALTVQGHTFTGMIVHLNNGSSVYSINNETLLAKGGAPLSGYTWSLANLSAFPAGATVDPLTGIFKSAGGILIAGTHNFEMTASDGSRSASGNFILEVEEYQDFGPLLGFQQPLGIHNLDLPDAITGYGYGASLWAIGEGVLPWSWYLASGELPPGLVIDQARGVVRGTPNSSAAGNTYSFTITVKDNNGDTAVTDGLHYHINVPR